ncbi:MAG: DUF2059 domain-containing protein [Verrucomicrobiota bacterium JB024]|nr:DUF2059 domain-containing protein [Verrucomicrobiota bacterium JB024]
MKTLLRTCSLLALTLIALPGLRAADTTAAGDSDIVFRAILDMGDERSFSLSAPSGENSRWVTPGGAYAGWTVGEYDPDTKTLTLDQDGQQLQLRLATAADMSGGSDTAAARAEAEKIFQQLNFEKMMREMMAKQRDAMLKMQREMMERSGQPVDERLLEIQASSFDEMNRLIDWNAMSDDMVNIYAETFSASQLKGINDFYATPSGQALIDKTPEVQQRTMEVIMPRIMEVMPAIQAKTTQLMKEYQAEKAAAAAQSQPASTAEAAPAQ